MQEMFKNWEAWAWSVTPLVGVLVLGLTGHYLLFKLINRFARRTPTKLDDFFVKHCREPSRWIIIIVILYLALPLFKISSQISIFLRQILSSLLIGSVAWLFIKIIFVAGDLILSQYKIDVKDNLRARRIHTQIQFFKKASVAVIGILALATILMMFDKVSQLGTSILASAGIIGIIVGFAAQRSIATFFAGLQIAITQPINIDDVVIVENEWGRIEEITLTYVVVRIWDLRRLILPITYFIEKPFQNWTRASADIIGTVFLYVDYTVPVQAVRKELQRVTENNQLWDRRVCALQVTNTTERAMELRAIVSASDASNAWSLRCEVREKLIEFIQKNYPDALPKVRAEFQETREREISSPPSDIVK